MVELEGRGHVRNLTGAAGADVGQTAMTVGAGPLTVRTPTDVGRRVTRILTCLDALAAAEQLLALKLRPTPGTFRERVFVFLQRVVGARARHLIRKRT